MSWEAQFIIWELELKAGPKWVLMGIANYTDQDFKCWPSLEVLSKKLGMTKQSVIAHVSSLVDLGLLTKERTKHYGGNTYRLNVEAIYRTVQKSLTDNSSKILTDQLKNFELKQFKNFDPNLIYTEPIREPIKHKAKKPTGIKWSLPNEIDPDDWAEYVEHRARRKAPLTEKIGQRIIHTVMDLYALGYAPAYVLHEAIDRNWIGLKAEWIIKESRPTLKPPSQDANDRISRVLRSGL